MKIKISAIINSWATLACLFFGCNAIALATQPHEDDKLRDKFYVRILDGAENCKIDDVNLVKLLYLSCISNRERARRPRSDLNCLDPQNVIGSLYTEIELPIPAPAPIRKARQQLHEIFAKILEENPDPQAVFEETRNGLKGLEQCPVVVEYTHHYQGQQFYKTDLADALGLRLNENTMNLVNSIGKETEGLEIPHDGFYSVSRHQTELRKERNRTLLTFGIWIDFVGVGAVGPGYPIVQALLGVPSESFYRHYGSASMTEETIQGCATIDDSSYMYVYRATALWRAGLSTLVPAQEKAALPFSDRVLDAQVLNTSINSGSWLTEKNRLPEGKRCP